MKRGPDDAHERNDTAASSPPPPFNIFAKLPQKPLSSTPLSNESTECESREIAAAKVNSSSSSPAVADSSSPIPPPTGKRWYIVVILALLAGILIGFALF